jgi:hypothetical protein
MNWKGCEREVMTYSEVYPSICLDGLRKTIQNLRKSKLWAKICIDGRIKTWNHKWQKYEKTILTENGAKFYVPYSTYAVYFKIFHVMR